MEAGSGNGEGGMTMAGTPAGEGERGEAGRGGRRGCDGAGERRAVEREAAALTARSGEMARDGGGDDQQGPVWLAARAGSSGPRWARAGPDLGQEGRRGGDAGGVMSRRRIG